MNRESIAFKLKAYLVSVTLLLVFSMIYSYVIMYNRNTFYPTANKGRILTNSTKIEVEKAFEDNNFESSIKSDYKYAVINLDGKVLMSSIDSYKKDSSVNLNEFWEYDSRFSNENHGMIRYSQPVIVKSVQVGIVVFYIPKDSFLTSSPMKLTILELIPVIISFIIIAILTIRSCIYIKKNVLEPTASLNESAKRILNGDFSYEIKYDYGSEIGTFCHNFEAMRDELKFSKEKEAKIKVNQKELLACISHDIKTPLTAINGYVSGIKDGIVKDKEGIQNYCTIILKRVRMLSKLLEDILEHSKAELNKMNIILTEVYCREFFKNILEDLSIEVESKGLKFIWPDQIPDLVINIDKKRISEVIYNLVSNSIKYSKENGSISVYFQTDKNYLKVFVKDTGIGIVSGDIPNIFRKFYRGEKSRNQNIPGSGLGLSISKYIVEAHGGFIKCEESSEKGTRMSFCLPI